MYSYLSLSLSAFFYLTLPELGIQILHVASWPEINPTDGFISLQLNKSNMEIQKPYDLGESEQYSFTDGVHKLWVFSTDKPMSLTSKCHRSEIRIRGYDYSSGVWQFEGYGYVPSGTIGVCIAGFWCQPTCNTTLMLRVYNGSLMYYRSIVLVPYIYDKWFRLNVIHDVDEAKIKIFIDGVLKLEIDGRGGTSHYFKCRVYAQGNESHCMESRWMEIKVLKIGN